MSAETPAVVCDVCGARLPDSFGDWRVSRNNTNGVFDVCAPCFGAAFPKLAEQAKIPKPESDTP